MGLTEQDIQRLQNKSQEIRRKIVQTTVWAGSAHIGGGLSETDILVALYYHYMKIDPKNPEWEERDRFILSKGHGAIGSAPILADRGYLDEKLLQDFNHTGSPFGMHLDRMKVPGVDASTGSLGHGLPISVGLALAAKLKNKSWRTYCVMGDGECAEGTVWEAAMAASHYKLNNLTAFVDRNGLSIDGDTEKIMALEPLDQKFSSFGWQVLTINGHDFREIGDAIEQAQATTKGPTIIIAKTVKGKGVDFMENQAGWHYGGLDSDKAEQALLSIDRMYGKA